MRGLLTTEVKTLSERARVTKGCWIRLLAQQGAQVVLLCRFDPRARSHSLHIHASPERVLIREQLLVDLPSEVHLFLTLLPTFALLSMWLIPSFVVYVVILLRRASHAIVGFHLLAVVEEKIRGDYLLACTCILLTNEIIYF